MEMIVEGNKPTDDIKAITASACTQEPGDNCWLQLD